MKTKNLINIFLLSSLLGITSCTSQKKLAYLNNLPELGGEETFTMSIPDYKIQPRDILYISAKAMTPDGSIKDFLSSGSSSSSMYLMQGDVGGAFMGYNVNADGFITLVPIGQVKVSGLTLEETRKMLQEMTEKVFKNSTVECKLLSFKFTVIGEVKGPGVFINYNNYLTVIEAIGRAGGVGDLGNRNRILVIRPIDKGTKTYRLNLQDKNIITSEAYFLLPNDVVIVEPVKQKIFNMNLPTISFILTTITSTITMTLLLISYLK
jgi:polysaccharide export outer membrane protein